MELRPYQKEAKEAVFEQWENGTRKTLLVLPTGCGKTIVFAKITEECVSHGDRVLILAHRGELLEQAADKILQTTGLNCAVEKAGQSCLGSWFRITVGSVQSLMRKSSLAAVRQQDGSSLTETVGSVCSAEDRRMRSRSCQKRSVSLRSDGQR